MDCAGCSAVVGGAFGALLSAGTRAWGNLQRRSTLPTDRSHHCPCVMSAGLAEGDLF